MKKKQNFKNLFFLLLIGVICSIGTIFIYIDYIQKKSIDNIIEQTQTPHSLIENQITIFKDKKIRMMSMLSEHSHMQEYLKNPSNKFNIQELFFSIVKSDKDYMQLRFIDPSGKEKIRIDQNILGKITVIENTKLQDKLQRDYVQEFLKLKKGELGFSKFDLNIENGKVQTPHVPTLRLGYKVFYKNQFKGIIVMNIFMEDWINNIFKINAFQIAVIDKNNFYKTHYDKNLSWSEYSKIPTKVKNIPNWQELSKPYYILNDNTIARSLILFKEPILVSYEMPRNIKSVLIENISSLLFTILIAFLFIFIPILLILYRYIGLIKYSEEYQKSIFDNMFDAMVVIDQNSIIQEVNKQVEELFGYSESELIGKNVNIFIPEPYHTKHNSYVENSTIDSRKIFGVNRELEALCKNKQTIPVSLAITKMKINNQNLFIGVARDLREIKKLQNENKKQEDLLQQQAKLASMGEMIGAIAHQWRQPLNEISIRIQNIKYAYLAKKVDEEYITNFISENKETIKFMSNTIDDFRDFFIIDKEKKEFNVKSSIESVINIQKAQLKDHNIELELIGEEFITYGFKNEFQQVILNLINNSKDALLEKQIKEPKIIISLYDSTVEVSDNAGGIPQEILDRIFEPYFTTKEQGKGTGMGLYLSKMIIIDNMNGKFEVINGREGAIFKITFVS